MLPTTLIVSPYAVETSSLKVTATLVGAEAQAEVARVVSVRGVTGVADPQSPEPDREDIG
jgi:hypothetical protein